MINFKRDEIPTITRNDAVNIYCLGTRRKFRDDGLYIIEFRERNEIESVDYLLGTDSIGLADIDELLSNKDYPIEMSRDELTEFFVAEYDNNAGGVVYSYNEEGYSLIVNIAG
jgi:hypothetical protein